VRHGDDSFGAFNGFEGIFAQLPDLPDQQSSLANYQMHYQEFSLIEKDSISSQVELVTHGIEPVSHLETGTSLNFQEGT